MKVLSVNTRAKIIRRISGLLVALSVASCQSQHAKTAGERSLASAGSDAFERLMHERPQCPTNTQLAFYETQIDVNRCLTGYIHDRVNQGLHQQYQCNVLDFAPQLRNLWPNKVYQAQVAAVVAPLSDPNYTLRIGANAQGYFLEVEAPPGATPSPEFVQREIRQITSNYGVNGATVRLFRCECDLTQYTVDECTQFYSSPAPATESVEVENSPSEV